MKRILSLTLTFLMLFTVITAVNAAGEPVHNFYASDNGIDYFSITNVLPEPSDKSYIQWIAAEKCNAPAVITAETDLTGFGVSLLVDVGTTYIEGTYLNADSHTEPFESGAPVAKGEKFTINDIGVYYVWATKAGIDEPVEATFEIASLKAKCTSSRVLVNGIEVQFEAYNINNNNYFKLRDVAKAISGTPKQFEVQWNATTGEIDLISGKSYTIVGGELAAGDGIAKDAFKGSENICKDGEYNSPKAYLINGNNYFKLRDLGQMFDFDVAWDGANNCVVIDTSKSYIGTDVVTSQTGNQSAEVNCFLQDYPELPELSSFVESTFLKKHTETLENGINVNYYYYELPKDSELEGLLEYVEAMKSLDFQVSQRGEDETLPGSIMFDGATKKLMLVPTNIGGTPMLVLGVN